MLNDDDAVECPKQQAALKSRSASFQRLPSFSGRDSLSIFNDDDAVECRNKQEAALTGPPVVDHADEGAGGDQNCCFGLDAEGPVIVGAPAAPVGHSGPNDAELIEAAERGRTRTRRSSSRRSLSDSSVSISPADAAIYLQLNIRRHSAVPKPGKEDAKKQRRRGQRIGSSNKSPSTRTTRRRRSASPTRVARRRPTLSRQYASSRNLTTFVQEERTRASRKSFLEQQKADERVQLPVA